MSKTIKGQVNAKWTSTDEYRSNYDRIFGKKPEESAVVGQSGESAEYIQCPACGGRLQKTSVHTDGRDVFSCLDCETEFRDQEGLRG